MAHLKISDFKHCSSLSVWSVCSLLPVIDGPVIIAVRWNKILSVRMSSFLIRNCTLEVGRLG